MTSRIAVASFRRSTRLTRLATAGAILGQLLWSAPLFAQDVATGTVQVASRAAADLQRKVAKARVKINRTVPKVTAPSLEVAFGIHVTTDALRRANVFSEPLIPAAPPGEQDNRELAGLLQTISTIPADQRLTRIDQYLAGNPGSPWRPSVLANAGTLYAHEGYFSRAAAYWNQAWELTQDSLNADTRDIADFALGESVTQMAMFGQVERLQQRLKEVEARDVHGPAASKVQVARSALSVLTEHHELAMFSGPEALKMYLTVAPTATLEQSVRTIAAYHPTMAGTNLNELRDLAASAGLLLDMVYAGPVGDIPVPSVAHLRSQHFAAIVGVEKDGRYIVRDPALGGTLRFTGAALRDEASGYFLVAPGRPDASDWRHVTAADVTHIVGHCAIGMPSNYDPPCPNCGGGGPGGPGGMPHYSFHPVSAALIIEDVPLAYTPPVGPAVSLQLSYNHRDGRQSQTLTYGNVGPIWTFNHLSYVTDHAYQILPPWVSASVYVRGYGMEWYDGTEDDVHPISRAKLVQVAYDPPRYERQLPDGTVEVFELPDRAASQYNRRIFLTEVIDPQGHALTYTYDSSFRMVAITDAIGQVTTLEYLDGADPLRLTRVTDPFSRVATLTYDALGRLASVTDVANLTSSFSYGASDFITVMMTPYGATTFKQGPFIAIEATDPAGGTERLEFHFTDTALADSEASNLVPTGFTGSK